MTMSIRNTGAVIANLKQYEERAKARAIVAVADSAERVYSTAHSLAPVDTGFMADHLRKEITPGGFGYQVGFRESDFAGKGFYPQWVIFGSSRMAGRDFLFAPNEAEKPRFKRALQEAIRTR